MPSLPPSITSRSNARVKALRASLSGDASEAGDLLGVEGLHLIGELHHAGHSFDTVYLREGSEYVVEQGWPAKLRTEHWAVLSRETFDGAVSTQTPQGIAATWIIRNPVLRNPGARNALVLENIQDPGNLGTLIRSAAAFGTERVMVTPESANHWSPKVVRAAAGAVFHTSVTRLSIEGAVAQLRSENVRIFAAVSGFHNGPEYGGLARLAARHGVLTGRVEDRDAPPELRYNRPSPAEGEESYAASLSYDTDFLEPCAILIGNEGAGLTQLARGLADEQVQITVTVESLNAAVAGAVLMYEVMRQRTLRVWAQGQGLRP